MDTIGNSDDPFTSIAITVAGIAATAVIGIIAAQSDIISRKLLLTPERLLAKRHSDYIYQWNKLLLGQGEALLKLHYFLLGNTITDENPDKSLSQYWEYTSTATDLQSLVDKIVSKTSTSYVRPLKLDKDPEDPKGEWYLYLLETMKDDNDNEAASEEVEDTEPKKKEESLLLLSLDGDNSNTKLYQVPLVPFCKLLETTWDNYITTTTLCFIADCSSGKTTEFLQNVLVESKSGVGIIKEPLWMAQFATLLLEPKIVTDPITITTCLSSLCRLEAWRLRNDIKQSKTVSIFVPGSQGLLPILLPWIIRIFPEERHVFAYDGCVSSVERGILAAKDYQRGTLAKSLNDACSLSSYSIPKTIPRPKSSSYMIRSLKGLCFALSQLPVSQASIVESWMTAIHTYFQLKVEAEAVTAKGQGDGGAAGMGGGYLPYVLQWSLLMNPNNLKKKSLEKSTSATTTTTAGNNNDTDVKVYRTDTYWCINSILQYITGCKSRPLPPGVVDAAYEYCKDIMEQEQQAKQQQQNDNATAMISNYNQKCIENCIFQHKLILIGDKTLIDTVQPKQHWTLKQAVKGGGCACCGPEDYLDEDEETTTASTSTTPAAGGDPSLDMSIPGAGFSNKAATTTTTTTTQPPPSASKPTKFVDGKLGFAFDPNQFK